MRYIWGDLSLMIFLISCSQNQVKKELAKQDISLVVIDIENQLSSSLKISNLGYAIAQNLKSKLEKDRGITVVKRPTRANFLEERKLLKKGLGVDYIITGVINNSSTNKIEYPTRERSEGGSSTGWTEYKACVSGSIEIFKAPFKKITKSLNFNHICIRQNHENYKEMLTRTAPKVVEDVLEDLEIFLVNDFEKI